MTLDWKPHETTGPWLHRGVGSSDHSYILECTTKAIISLDSIEIHQGLMGIFCFKMLCNYKCYDNGWSLSWGPHVFFVMLVKYKKVAWCLCCLRLEICYDWVPSRLFWDRNSSKSSTLRHRLHRNLQEVPTWGWLKSFGNALSRQKSACSFFSFVKENTKNRVLNRSLMRNSAKPQKKTRLYTTYLTYTSCTLPVFPACLVEATYPKFRVIPGREAAKAVTWALWGPKYSKASFFAAMR